MGINKFLPIICLICLITAGGCAGKTKTGPDTAAQAEDTLSPERRMELATMYQEQGKLEMAVLNYDKYLKKVPGDIHILKKRGLAHFELDHNSQAMRDLAQVLKKNPGDFKANEALGIISFENGLTDRAEKMLSVAAADPDLWRAHTYMGLIHGKRGQYPQAVREFQIAHNKRPNNPDVLNNLGVAQVMSGNLDQALNHFVEAVRHGASKAKIYNNLGMVLVKKNQLNKALQAFLNAGDPARAYNNLGYSLMVLGRYQEAIPYLEKAIELSPRFYVRAYENLKRARMSKGLILAGGQQEAPVSLQEPSAQTEKPMPGQSAPVPNLNMRPGSPAVSNISHENQPRIVPAAMPAQIKDTTTTNFVNLYGVHTSSWQTEDKAQRMAAERRGKGLDATVVRIETKANKVWYRVVLGQFANKEAARNLLKSLENPADTRVVKFKTMITADQLGET